MTILVETLILLLFLSKFFKIKTKVTIFIVWSFIQLFRQKSFIEFPNVSFCIGFVIDYILLVYCFQKDNHFKKIFALLMFYIFSFIFDTFIVCLYVLIFKDVSFLEKIEMLGVLSKIGLLIFVTNFKKVLYQEKRLVKWIVLYSLPTFCILILLIIFPYMISELNIMVTKLIGIIALLSLILNILLIKLLSKKVIIEKQKNDLETLEKIKNINTEKFIKIREHYKETEKIAHDIKKHLSFIYYAKSLKETKNYVSKLLNKDFNTLKVYTGNFDVDTILSIFKDDIKINCYGSLPNSIEWVSSVDLNTILSNIIENAIKHSDCIKINFVYKDNWFIIGTENYTNQNIKSVNKGIGTVNIEETIKKYNGNLIYKIENNIFYTDILLQKK